MRVETDDDMSKAKMLDNNKPTHDVKSTEGKERTHDSGQAAKLIPIESFTKELPSTKEKKNKRTERKTWLLMLSVGVLIVDILLLALICVLLAKRFKPKAMCPNPEEFCLPCESLRLSPGENKQHFREFGYNRVDEALDGDCCARSPEKLQRLIEIFVIRKRRIRRLKEIKNHPATDRRNRPSALSTWRPAAHLVTRNQSRIDITDQNKININWDDENNSSTSFVQGLNRSENRVIVLESGHYYLFSQLMFEEVGNSSSGLESVCHFLVRYRSTMETGETNLLSNTQKLLGVADKTHSSYIGAVFKLEQGDSLGIKVSGNGARINPTIHPHGNFFGLYKV